MMHMYNVHCVISEEITVKGERIPIWIDGVSDVIHVFQDWHM
jgi:hypothetical protein